MAQEANFKAVVDLVDIVPSEGRQLHLGAKGKLFVIQIGWNAGGQILEVYDAVDLGLVEITEVKESVEI